MIEGGIVMRSSGDGWLGGRTSCKANSWIGGALGGWMTVLQCQDAKWLLEKMINVDEMGSRAARMGEGRLGSGRRVSMIPP